MSIWDAVELIPYAGQVIGVLSDDEPEGFGKLQMHYGAGALVVEQADPRVRIPGSLVREQFGEPSGPGWRGARLVINGANRRVVYVIGEYHEPGEDGIDWYEAEFPD